MRCLANRDVRRDPDVLLAEPEGAASSRSAALGAEGNACWRRSMGFAIRGRGWMRFVRLFHSIRLRWSSLPNRMK